MIFFIITFLSTFLSLFHVLSARRHENIIYKYNKNERGISIIIPCYNEAPIIKNTIEGINKIDYENYEAIFINDGSNDDTLKILFKELKLKKYKLKNSLLLQEQVKNVFRSEKYRKMYVIDKINTGKADSLNTGIYYSKKELILTMDGDCVLKEDALKVMNSAFNDQNVIACGGAVHVMQMFKLNNRPRLLILLQSLDFIKGFYVYKSSLAYNDALAIISGAFGIFNKDVLLKIGCFKEGLGEDIDITLRIQEYASHNNNKIVFIEDSICYTECPENLRDLSKQRVRWQKGFIDSIIKNKEFVFYNIFKLRVCFFIIFDAVIVNTIAIFVLIINFILALIDIINENPNYILLYLIILTVFNYIYSFQAIKKANKYIDGIKRKSLYMVVLLDMLFFRLLYIYFFIKGSIMYCFDSKGWNKLKRTNNSYNL